MFLYFKDYNCSEVQKMKYELISVKPETRRTLIGLKFGLNLKTYDDVLRILIERASVKEETITISEI